MKRETKEEAFIDLGVVKIGAKIYAGIMRYTVNTYYLDGYGHSPDEEQSIVRIEIAGPVILKHRFDNADVVWPLSLLDIRRGVSIDDKIKRAFDKWRPYLSKVRSLQPDLIWNRVNMEYNVLPEKGRLTYDGYTKVKENGQ